MSRGRRAKLSRERLVAAQILLRFLKRPGRVDLWITEEGGSLSPDEARRLRALVYGIFRSRNFLVAHLNPFLPRPFDSQDPVLRMTLLLGTYELLFQDSVPDRAAVDQAVELVRDLGQGGKTGLVNAVLRRVASRQDRPELPDAGEDPEAWCAVWTSHPQWILDEMLGRVPLDELPAWCDASNREPPVALALRSFASDAVDLVQAGLVVEARPGELIPEALVLDPPLRRRIDRLPGFSTGAFWVQDEGAQAVCQLLDLQPGQSVLDACASPGGKTLWIARAVGPEGRVHAVDLPSRRALLLDSVGRVGCKQVTAHGRDLIAHPWGSLDDDQLLDAVLLDAPCSGLGVLRRHPEIRWARRKEGLAGYADRQLTLLRAVAPAVRPGGALVYSVCTFSIAETDAVIGRFLTETDEGGAFAVASSVHGAERLPRDAYDGQFLRTYPHRHGSDAFFAVRLERRTGGN